MVQLVARISDLAAAIRDKLNSMTAKFSPASILVVIDGGGAAITTGIKTDIQIPFGCTLQGWTILADAAGSIEIDLWKTSYSNAPPNGANSITASTKPTLASAVKSSSTIFTGWTMNIAADDVIRVNVNSVTDVKRVTLILKVQRQ